MHTDLAARRRRRQFAQIVQLAPERGGQGKELAAGKFQEPGARLRVEQAEQLLQIQGTPGIDCQLATGAQPLVNGLDAQLELSRLATHHPVGLPMWPQTACACRGELLQELQGLRHVRQLHGPPLTIAPGKPRAGGRQRRGRGPFPRQIAPHLQRFAVAVPEHQLAAAARSEVELRLRQRLHHQRRRKSRREWLEPDAWLRASVHLATGGRGARHVRRRARARSTPILPRTPAGAPRQRREAADRRGEQFRAVSAASGWR